MTIRTTSSKIDFHVVEVDKDDLPHARAACQCDRQRPRHLRLAHYRYQLATLTNAAETVELPLAAHDSELHRWARGFDFLICQTVAASPAEQLAVA
jgi:hypothetical protein